MMQTVFVLFFAVVVMMVWMYRRTNYSPKFFHVIHLIFFLSFMISMYSFYVQNQQFELDRKTRYVSIILERLYDAETNVHNLSKFLFCLETIAFLDPSVIRPEELGQRLRRLSQRPTFQQYWDQQGHTYSLNTQRLVMCLTE